MLERLRATLAHTAIPAVGLAAALAAGLSVGALAQTPGASPFAGFKHDSSQPIEVSADSLEVRNADQVAVFRGSVDVRQGVVRMRAAELEVTYKGDARAATAPGASGGDQGAIERLQARGDVIISNGEETARSDAADYDVASGQILLTGAVMLLQGDNVVQGDRLVIDLASGEAQMEGQSRVRVQLDPSSANR